MRPRHQISRAAIILIKRFEGFRASAAQLDDGRWTIGYGHTKTARPGAKIGEADAEALLLYDLIGVAHAVNEWSFAPLNQNQFDALVCFAFNVGLENFRRSTTLRRLNEGRNLEAALAMELWRRADFEGERIVIDALVRRRAYEKTLFLKPIDGWPAAPSPVLPPKLDFEAAAVMPGQTPTVVTARLDGDRAVVDRQPPAPFSPLSDEDAPSASQAAAAAVSARLESLLADEPQHGDQSPGHEAPRDLDAPLLLEDSVPTSDQGAQAEPTIDSPRTVPLSSGRKARRASDGRPGPLALFALGQLGVALFAAALNWGFRPAPGLGPWTPLLIGWGGGGLGIACFAVAAYFLLARLGEPEDSTRQG